MGKDMYCDLCRSPCALEENMQLIQIGGAVVAEGCYNCAQSITTAVKQKIIEAREAISKAVQEQQPDLQPQPEQPTPAPQPAPAPRDGPVPSGSEPNA